MSRPGGIRRRGRFVCLPYIEGFGLVRGAEQSGHCPGGRRRRINIATPAEIDARLLAAGALGSHADDWPWAAADYDHRMALIRVIVDAALGFREDESG